MQQPHSYYMQLALNEAWQAYEKQEVPVGAVVVQDGKIIGRGHNMVETLTDATAHAEIIALTAAFNYMGAKYLPHATLYVTLEPCGMCAGALYWSKIGQIVYGASDDKNGCNNLYKANPFHPQTVVEKGVLAAECAALLKTFFKERRK